MPQILQKLRFYAKNNAIFYAHKTLLTFILIDF